MQLDLLNQNSVNVGVITLKEITDLITVEHNKAMKVVEKLTLEPNFGAVEKSATVYNDRGQTISTYLLTKKQAIAVGAKLNNNLLMKVIDRLEELENKLLQKNLPTPLETARMLVQVLEEKEALLLTNKALEKQNTILMHTNNLYTASEIAKELNLKSATALNQKLADMKIQYKVNNSWVLYSKYADLGYTSIKQHILENGKEIYDRKFTQTGRDFILKLFELEGTK
jgi:hypothetical protein